MADAAQEHPTPPKESRPTHIADLAGIGRGSRVEMSLNTMREIAHEERWRAKQARSRRGSHFIADRGLEKDQ